MDLPNKANHFSLATVRFSQSAIRFEQVAIRFAQTAIRFAQAIGLAVVVAAFFGASAHAGGKIFKTTDSEGNVTFTDVPLLLEPQLQRGLQDQEKLISPQRSKLSRQKLCESMRASKIQPCQDKPE